MDTLEANRRLIRANSEYARKIAVLRHGIQDALVLLRRADADVGRALEALDRAYRTSFNPGRDSRRPTEAAEPDESRQ